MSRDPRIPPEYEGQIWPYRTTEYVDGEPVERTVASPFPPVMVGVPGEITEAFIDFQRHHGRYRRQEYPGWYCDRCGAPLSEPALRLKRTTCAHCLGWTAKELKAEAVKIGVRA